MRKKNANREAFQFLFKVFILFQLYSYLKSTTEASIHIKEDISQLDGADGTNLNDRMSQIEAKSRRQENDVSFLKAIIIEDKRIIRQLRGRVSNLESFMLAKTPKRNDQLVLRQKRPYRLLPVHSGGNKLEKEKARDNIQFYGPASNCNELGKLGYTLNGYYLVKGKGESISNSVEAVLCQFNLPEESKGGIHEERLGLVTIRKTIENAHIENQIELKTTQITTNKNELKATERNLHGFISSIDSTTTAKPSAIPSSTRAKLINGLGKCASIDPSREINSVNIRRLYQWDCNSTKGESMLWSWNAVSLGSGDRHLCNYQGRCAATPYNLNKSNHLLLYYHKDEDGQRFSFVDILVHPGFYVIRNDHGKCLSVPENNDRNGAPIWASDCNLLEEGQRWKWIN